MTQKRKCLNYNVLFYCFFFLSPILEYMPNWLDRCLRFYVVFITFGDTIQIFDSDGLLCRNSGLVFPGNASIISLLNWPMVFTIFQFIFSAFRDVIALI